MKIKNYTFKKTCDACPEQYDVFDGNGKQVAYVRLRWGGLSARCPDVDGTYIYSAGIGNDCGCFRSEDERILHLKRIAKRIEQFYYPFECHRCGAHLTMTECELDTLNELGNVVIDCDECDSWVLVRDDGDGLYTCRRSL